MCCSSALFKGCLVALFKPIDRAQSKRSLTSSNNPFVRSQRETKKPRTPTRDEIHQECFESSSDSDESHPIQLEASPSASLGEGRELSDIQSFTSFDGGEIEDSSAPASPVFSLAEPEETTSPIKDSTCPFLLKQHRPATPQQGQVL